MTPGAVRKPASAVPPRRGAGFTLVEVLIVVVIVGILAALAVPASSRLRARAYDAAALADVVNAGKAIEALDSNASFAVLMTGPGPIRDLPGARVSAGTELFAFRIALGPNRVIYQVSGSHRAGSGATYYVNNGHLFALGAQL